MNIKVLQIHLNARKMGHPKIPAYIHIWVTLLVYSHISFVDSFFSKKCLLGNKLSTIAFLGHCWFTFCYDVLAKNKFLFLSNVLSQDLLHRHMSYFTTVKCNMFWHIESDLAEYKFSWSRTKFYFIYEPTGYEIIFFQENLEWFSLYGAAYIFVAY